ncbi:MAG: NAD(P)-dependent alcohol dehydrogenase [Tateyamaria sp.]|jgi:NAD+-dependent secondary alcohol dehydrogenase Adh1|nr:NAD(P)-dependent alcohol dehydrogenase [Tateyamaria sp.]MBT5302996.1 NAD(P)-dependent alcohol dehydrogenase [Tateyamaria sp.]MBT6268363.1 NAD(P)-dependent alcohol dehydrogenase [Tateyamaria sp.]MBT6344928.1 NAD(P)-dependent alcohol dehydrogenase [Tateyamaria sp.]MBT7801742.1 NAD(P)-dependent alcohol dehydrogenase [Tateyamaria sp.]
MKAQVLHKYDDDLTASSWVSYEDVPDPVIAKSSDVIVRIGGAGVCRTDLHVIEGVWRPHMDPTGSELLPFILGHENAGWIEEIGPEVEGLKVGDPVIVHPKISNGTCIACRRGQDMHGEGTFPGLDSNGGYAEALVTSARNIVALPKTLSPKDVAPYSDAGLTAYRAAKKATRHLLPGEYCVVIGAGGLGHIAIQVLRAMCAAEIIVVDTSDVSLQLAQECGADHLIKADGGEVDAVLSITKGHGAEAVIDFVGEKGTTAKGIAMTRNAGSYYVVGYGEDVQVPTVDLVITEKNIIGNLVGTWSELTELMELAHRGLVQLETHEFKLEDANAALQSLHNGKIKGRAVLVP